MRLLILAAARADVVARYGALAEREPESAERWIDAIEAASARLLEADGPRAGWPFEARRAKLRGRGVRIFVPGREAGDSALLFRAVRDDIVIVRVLDVKRTPPKAAATQAR